MAGYDGFSKSNNAISAEFNGKFPISIVAKKAKVPTGFVRMHFSPCEWHHTSKWYNTVDYYDLEEVIEWLGTDEGKSALAKDKANTIKAKEKSIVHLNCTVKWLDWYGTRNNPKCEEMKESGAIVSVKGKTATITLQSGKVFTKRLNTNGFSFKQNDSQKSIGY